MHKCDLDLPKLHPFFLRRSQVVTDTCRGVGRSSFFVLFLFLSFCLCPSFVSAQVSATVSGIVTDQSGAAVPAANATARNVDTGLSRDTITDQAGRYQVFALPLGQYEVRVKKAGFAEAVQTGIRLAVGQDARVDLTLRVGAVSEEIKVSGDAASVSLTTQDISGLVGEQQVKDLPLNGRSYDLLLTIHWSWTRDLGLLGVERHFVSRTPDPAVSRGNFQSSESGQLQHSESDRVYSVWSFGDGRGDHQHVDHLAAGAIRIETDLVGSPLH